MTWRLADVSLDARRAADAGAAASGKPLAEWIAETVRAAVVKELGALPEPPTPEPPLRVVAPAAPAPVRAIEPAPPVPAREPPPRQAAEPTPPVPAPRIEAPPPVPIPERVAPRAVAPTPQEPTTGPAPTIRRAEPEPVDLGKHLPVMGRVQSNRISPEAQRLAATGVSSWLATRIEGLPPRAAPTEPVLAAAASLASIGAGPAPPKPQLDLFPKGPDPAAPTAATPAPTGSEPPPAIVPLSLPTKPVVMLPVAALRPGRYRARRSGGDDGIPALAASVATHGVREPILVRRATHDPPAYEVVAGERRRLAAERAGRAEIPAVIVSVNDTEALMLSLTENLGRRDFSPLDEARAYLKLLTDYRINPGAMALRLARERAHIAMTLRLLGLPERIRQYIDSGQIRPEQAYELLKAPNPDALAEQMVRGAAGPALGPG